MDDMVKKSAKELEKVLNDNAEKLKKEASSKKGRYSIAAATAGYILSKDDKERNAILIGLATYLITPEDEEEKKEF